MYVSLEACTIKGGGILQPGRALYLTYHLRLMSDRLCCLRALIIVKFDAPGDRPLSGPDFKLSPSVLHAGLWVSTLGSVRGWVRPILASVVAKPLKPFHSFTVMAYDAIQRETEKCLYAKRRKLFFSSYSSSHLSLLSLSLNFPTWQPRVPLIYERGDKWSSSCPQPTRDLLMSKRERYRAPCVFNTK